MKVIVTCGPSYEPIDEVRRITNFSTGELGILLANRLTRAGFDVLCFKGVGATCPLRVEGARTVDFTTNENLRAEFEAVESRGEVLAVFHAAALSDYRVKSVRSSSGAEIAAAMEEIGRVLVPGPLLAHLVGCAAIAAVASEEQKKRILPKL